MTIALDGRLLPPLLTGISCFLGMLGSLCLAYDLSNRQSKALLRCIWIFSSGFLVGSVLFISFFLLFGSEYLLDGYSTGEIWRFAGSLGLFGFILQLAFFFPLPQVRPPTFHWFNALWLVVFSGIFICEWGGSFSATHDPIATVMFALPALLVIGLLNGFSAAIHWWILHLPEKRVAYIGSILIFCAFALASVQPLYTVMGISW